MYTPVCSGGSPMFPGVAFETEAAAIETGKNFLAQQASVCKSNGWKAPVSAVPIKDPIDLYAFPLDFAPSPSK